MVDGVPPECGYDALYDANATAAYSKRGNSLLADAHGINASRHFGSVTDAEFEEAEAFLRQFEGEEFDYSSIDDSSEAARYFATAHIPYIAEPVLKTNGTGAHATPFAHRLGLGPLPPPSGVPDRTSTAVTTTMRSGVGGDAGGSTCTDGTAAAAAPGCAGAAFPENYRGNPDWTADDDEDGDEEEQSEAAGLRARMAELEAQLAALQQENARMAKLEALVAGLQHENEELKAQLRHQGGLGGSSSSSLFLKLERWIADG